MTSRFRIIVVGIFLAALVVTVSSYTALPDAQSTDAWTQQQINKREELYQNYFDAINRGATEEEMFELQDEIRDINKSILDHRAQH